MSAEEKLHCALMDFCKAQGSAPQADDISVDRNWTGRIFAFVICDTFDTVEVTERQKRLWKYLRENLPEDVLAQIAVVFTKGRKEGITEREYRAQKGLPASWPSA